MNKNKIIYHFISFSLLSITTSVNAADIAGAFDNYQSQSQREVELLEREREKNNISRELKREKEFQEKQQETGSAIFLEELGKNSELKFHITKIIVDNDKKYEFSPKRTTIINKYINTNMGKNEILKLLVELNNFYIAKGYTTTQVTIIPGNLKNGTLHFSVLWGKLNAFSVNGDTPSWRNKQRLFSAMPFSTEKPINIQDVDQALDNLLRVSPKDGLKITPTVKDGYSNIDLITQGFFPLSLSLGLNNSGTHDSGWDQYTLNIMGKNLFGFNDTISFFQAWNDLDASRDRQKSKNLSYSMPLGYWLFDINHYESYYKRKIKGNFGSYSSDGNSKRTSLKISRLIYRNATGKFSGYVKTERRENLNKIENTVINVSSKKYAQFNSGLNYTGQIYDGWLYIDGNVTFGIPWFSAAWKDDPDLAGFDLNYKKYNGTLNWFKDIYTTKNGRFAINYAISSGFQFSPDILVSDARYSLGDEYTIRGYKDDNVMAENASYISQTLSFPVNIYKYSLRSISPFVGFDMGFAKRNCAVNSNQCKRDYMSGSAIGVNFYSQFVTASLTAGWPVTKPKSLKNNNIDHYNLYFRAGINF
ncbi:POTRA domain-containing protein [Pantoea sp. LMR881]|uniref:ShlB/FhaC/HecB family hemolysin secretion/activation protein n=1 Tax=Pantoea sp. LMR881 TaxID=3014336 RepID=UPI0022B07DEB|nr:ShlB/FhaC/HecB family hemolysin secretion/activation protein [Pantoea sp. LMR881]MCZ4058968.1 POTRA domain-containing protein [Pantoea sp. LMR881]